MSSQGPLKDPNSAELYSLRFPYRKSVRIRRDLKHFDEWMKAIIKISIDGRIFRASLYKTFFLCSVSLYPTSNAYDNLIPKELRLDLQQLGLTDSRALSCSEASSLILTVIRWQQYEFGVDAQLLMNELIPFYHKLNALVDSKELTYKQAVQSDNIFKVFRRYELPGANPIRDSVILMMTWVVGCTPDELVNFSFLDLEPLDALNWVYHRKDAQGLTRVKLDNYTMASIIELIGTATDVEAEACGERILSICDGNCVRPFTENEIEIIIEQHYRFAEALYGFEPYSGINASQGRELDFSPSEEGMLSGMVKAVYDRMMDMRMQLQAPPLDEDSGDDWDVAVQRARMRKQTIGQQDTGYKLRDDNDEQVDWDNAVIKRKET
jgi:hypothetical protein